MYIATCVYVVRVGMMVPSIASIAVVSYMSNMFHNDVLTYVLRFMAPAALPVLKAFPEQKSRSRHRPS